MLDIPRFRINLCAGFNMVSLFLTGFRQVKFFLDDLSRKMLLQMLGFLYNTQTTQSNPKSTQSQPPKVNLKSTWSQPKVFLNQTKVTQSRTKLP